MTNSHIRYRQLTTTDFDEVIRLANQVHGLGYLCHSSLQQYLTMGTSNNINANFVALMADKLVGFRLTFAPQKWQIDQWCSPQLWQIATDKVCYFKCNTVDPNCQGHGIGGQLLKHSINAVKQQGALAGISHLWRQSPGNAAVKYFTKCGGQLIKDHPDKWNEDSKNGYHCVLCGNDCHCVAAEMIIRF